MNVLKSVVRNIFRNVVRNDFRNDTGGVHKSVSREHCAIEHVDGELRLRDLDSTGGTFRGTERIEEVRIEDGLEITVGPALLKFYDAGL